ncbi:hypothetical protein [Paracoccus sp. (in: a-proteobacteria)]|uniref:hypothetical protein n=1 Tax=Paracoccus sp. TaxID=267 RepID=UPI0035B2A841
MNTGVIDASPAGLTEIVRQISRSPTANRIARHPALKVVLLIAQDVTMTDQEKVDQMKAASVIGHPAAMGNVVSPYDRLVGHVTAEFPGIIEVAGLQPRAATSHASPFSGEFWSKETWMASTPYGLVISPEERFAAANDILSYAADRRVSISDLSAAEIGAILDGYVLEATQKAAQVEEDDAEGVRVTGNPTKPPEDPCDEICRIACACKANRGDAPTITECVARQLRSDHYDTSGKNLRPDGTPRYPRSPAADGPRAEVSYRQGANGRYTPVTSTRFPDMPSSAPVVRGAPRPDISWWKGGKLWKIFELKFGNDGQTAMQAGRVYERVAEDLGLDPRIDLQTINVDEDCDCQSGKAKPGIC